MIMSMLCENTFLCCISAPFFRRFYLPDHESALMVVVGRLIAGNYGYDLKGPNIGIKMRNNQMKHRERRKA